jgi:glycosyltransferase involved in cell wall biosynthesis
MFVPHVLIVSNHWQAKIQCRSAGIFVDRQIESLRQAGIRVSTFDIGLSHSPVHLFRKWLELRRHVRQIGPDLVHAHYGTIVGAIAAMVRCPLVISFCGNDLLSGAAVSRLRMIAGFILSNLAALRAQRIICKSAELQQALWWRRNRATVIPSGVDMACFSPGSRDEARKKLGWDLDRPIILFNSGTDPWRKGLDIAEAAMKVVQSRLGDAQLIVISNIEPNRMPLYYHGADVLLCASLREGSPNVVKEALACNLPIVSTPVGDVAERLAGVVPSAIVNRTPIEIGEALVTILLDGRRSNGRVHVAHLSLDRIAERILEVYHSALGRIPGDSAHSERLATLDRF